MDAAPGRHEQWLAPIAVVGAAMALAAAVSLSGWASTWSRLLIPTLEPAFADMRTVQGAIETAAEGGDPQRSNPNDPWGRVMNYPLVWVQIGRLFGLEQENNFLVFVLSTVVAYVAAVAAIAWRSGSLLVPALFVSGASLLAMERGNNDLVVFVLLFLAAAAGIRARLVFVLLAAFLKVYPVVALVTLLRRRRDLVVVGFALLALGAVLLPQFADIRSGTPGSSGLSYGVTSLLLAIGASGTGFWHLAVASILVLMMLTGAVALARWPAHSIATANEQNRAGFLLGAAAYCGTFVVGSNWDYRLILLLLCVPAVVEGASLISRSVFGGLALLAFNERLLAHVFGTLGWVGSAGAKTALAVLVGATAAHAGLEELRRVHALGDRASIR